MSEQQQSPQAGQEPGKQPEKQTAEPTPHASAPAEPEAPAPQRMDPVRKWVLIFGAFCLFLLAWYMAADRYTPFTTQARVNAFVVPIAPQVAGEILTVDVRTNRDREEGQLLARIDPARYQLAVAAAEAQLALTEQNLKVSTSTVDAAAASLDAAKAALVRATQNEARLQRIEADVSRRDFAAPARDGHHFAHVRPRPRWPRRRPTCRSQWKRSDRATRGTRNCLPRTRPSTRQSSTCSTRASWRRTTDW